MKKKSGLIIPAIVVVLAISAFHFYPVVFSAPGSDLDPLVAKSYVDQEISKLNNLIMLLTEKEIEMNTKIAKLEEQLSAQQPVPDETDNASSESAFKVIQLLKGQSLIAGEGTEIIVRRGQVTAISGANGDGIADLTQAKDLYTGNEIPMNHYLVSSRDDGRGLRAQSDGVFLLIKGKYQLQ